ncbi:hypothetical protein LR48_Vigan107s003700 [Vigna angularis]|uniref:Uncharacterized protein n=1 Tax=Phaseolus angularis TaxID=3914 RepID=A0A0L9T4L6_PHAAN|nr:uncharacterized protein HKW66_Vig0004380 [Vigna angularis]KOM25518.1 hypothetical protein LR48_Vigan107s003700 [Vigna angularis]
MAADTTSSFSTYMVLFISLLLLSHFTMALLEQNFSPSTSNKEDAENSNTKVVASAREDSEQNSKDLKVGETGKRSIHVPKREHSQSPNRIFNASAHEVPSGPNPISNSEVFVHIVVMKLKA